MSGNFAGKVALITGATSGIGQATAMAFAQAGAKVVIADISEQGIQETARMIEGAGGQVLAVRCDVTKAEDIKTALDETTGAFGRLDFAFNNAGIEQPVMPVVDLSEADWDRIANVNVRGVFLCMKYQIPLMLKQAAARS